MPDPNYAVTWSAPVTTYYVYDGYAKKIPWTSCRAFPTLANPRKIPEGAALREGNE